VIALELSSDAHNVLDRFDRLPSAMLRMMVAGLDEANQTALGHIVRTKLSQRGPETLGVDTNRLRGSSRAGKTTIQGTALHSNLGTNVPYAAVHEFGYEGQVNVPGFWRRAPQGDRFSLGTDLMRTVITRPMAKKLGAFGKRGRLKQRFTKVSSGRAFVRPHTRQLKFPERAMFRTGIAESKGVYETALSGAILKAWQNP
jgi:hypothetical protein